MKIHNIELLDNFYTHEKKNIAIFSDIFYPTLGGATFVVDSLAKSLQNREDCNVVVVTGQVKNHEDSAPYPIIRCKSMPIPKTFGDSLPMPNYDKKFKNLLKKLNLDIIHIHTVFGVATFGISFAQKYNIPIVFHGHSKFNEEYASIFNHKFNFISQRLANRAFKIVNKADLVFTVSRNTKDVYLTRGGITKDIVVLENATDLKPTNNEEEAKKYIFEKHGIDENQKNVFVIITRIEIKTKNLDLLLESLKNIKQKGEDFRLLVVGEGKDFAEVKKLAKSLGLEKEVVFAGLVRDREIIKYYYKRADLLTFPSVVDTSALVKYEAGTQKTPMLAIKNTGASEEIIDNVNGFLADNTVKAYSEKLLEIISNPEKLQEVADEAHKTLSKSWDNVAEICVKHYEELIKNKKG